MCMMVIFVDEFLVMVIYDFSLLMYVYLVLIFMVLW